MKKQFLNPYSPSHPKYKKKEKSSTWISRVRKPRLITKNGYVLLSKKGHYTAQVTGYIFEHRLIMENHLGRYLRPEEVVHHINGIRTDNRIKNLMLFKSNAIHTSYEAMQRKLPLNT